MKAKEEAEEHSQGEKWDVNKHVMGLGFMRGSARRG